MSRVLVIGLDSASLDLVRIGIQAGKLPHLAQFQTDGVLGPLESTYPPASVPAWNAFSTGRTPDNMGIPWFFVRRRGTYRFQPYIFDDERREVPFWDYAHDRGKRIGVVNVPTMHKAYPLNGCSVCGFFRTKDSPLTFPPDLERDIEREVGPYQVDIWDARRAVADSPDDLGGGNAPVREDLVYETASRNAKNRLDTLRHLMYRYDDWDLFIGVFTALDRLQHTILTKASYRDQSRVIDYYRELDGHLGELMDLAGTDTDVIILSDHGMGPRTWTFNINDWLCDVGLMKLKSPKTPPRKKLDYWRESLRRCVLPVSERYPSFDHWIQVLKSAFGITSFASEGSAFDPEVIDWNQTKAYSYGNYGEVFLNCVGREPDGCVSPDEADHIYRDLRDRLGELPMPWRPKSLELLRGSKMFSGSRRHKMPDFFLKIDDYECTTSSSLNNPSLFVRKKGGVHRLHGIFGARGPSFVRAGDFHAAHITDLAPTILHLLKVPVPEDMDGDVLHEILVEKTPVTFRRPMEAGLDHTPYSENDENILAERLRSLGYLD